MKKPAPGNWIDTLKPAPDFKHPAHQEHPRDVARRYTTLVWRPKGDAGGWCLAVGKHPATPLVFIPLLHQRNTEHAEDRLAELRAALAAIIDADRMAR